MHYSQNYSQNYSQDYCQNNPGALKMIATLIQSMTILLDQFIINNVLTVLLSISIYFYM